MLYEVITRMLELRNVNSYYGNIQALYDVDLYIDAGEIITLIGANGAGKSTTLKAISNLLGAERGDVTKGSISYKGENVHALNPSELVKRGVIQVMEGRHCFEHLV